MPASSAAAGFRPSPDLTDLDALDEVARGNREIFAAGKALTLWQDRAGDYAP
jgi:hypothetical protein